MYFKYSSPQKPHYLLFKFFFLSLVNTRSDSSGFSVAASYKSLSESKAWKIEYFFQIS